jgi:hypothetical protein
MQVPTNNVGILNSAAAFGEPNWDLAQLVQSVPPVGGKVSGSNPLAPTESDPAKNWRDPEFGNSSR